MTHPSKIHHVQVHIHGQSFAGTLKLTPNHLIFHSSTRDLWFPYPIIASIERQTPPTTSQSCLRLRNKDFTSISLFFPQPSLCDYTFEFVIRHTCIGGNNNNKLTRASILSLYAFCYKPGLVESCLNSWSLYDPKKEFARLGVDTRTKEWRFTQINADFKRCPSYPELLVVPTKISDSTLHYGHKYRSKGRIPALTYIHPPNNVPPFSPLLLKPKCTITRSSQPLVGIKQNRSIQDEKLLEAIFATTHPKDVHLSQPTNLIIDARPTKNAFANVAIGAGTEDMTNYKNAQKAYLGIDNIHVMRDSLAKLVQDLVPLPPNRELLAKSGWLKHITAIIDGALLIIKTIHLHHSSVLVHCSDGWDRTSQLCALSQLCLDPYYRTLEGFMVLVEKDWMSFGHRFADRCDHLASENNSGISIITRPSKESSPIFHQFLDCTEQIRQQFSCRFEFNSRFLKRILYHLYSCQYGNFISNSEKERRQHRIRERTRSLWDYFLTRRTDFLSDCYTTTSDASDPVLLPDPKLVHWWSDVFGRADDEMNAAIKDGP